MPPSDRSGFADSPTPILHSHGPDGITARGRPQDLPDGRTGTIVLNCLAGPSNGTTRARRDGLQALPVGVTVARTSCRSWPGSLDVEVGEEGVVLLLLGVGAVTEFLELGLELLDLCLL